MTRREALGAIGALAACSGCQRQRGKQRVRLANWGGSGDDSEFYRLVQGIYAEFEVTHPRLELCVEGTPGSQDYVTKLLQDHVSRTTPEIVTLDASSAAVFIENRVVRDLSPFVNRDGFDLSAYFPNVVDIARRGEALFAVPTDFTPMVVYCNAAHFRDAGLPLPTGTWSFEEFLVAAKALTTRGRFGFDFANWMPAWVMFLWNNGGDVLSADGSRAVGHFDSPSSIGAVQFLADLVLKHKVAPDISQTAAAGVDFFATGRAAMKVSGHWNLVGLASSKNVSLDDIHITELPTNRGASVTVMYESGPAIGTYCDDPEAGWEFIKFWSTKSVQQRYNASGIAVSGRKDVALDSVNDTKRSRASRARASEFQRIVPSARPPWGARTVGYDRVESIGQTALDLVLKSGVSVKDALRDAAAQIDKELNRL